MSDRNIIVVIVSFVVVSLIAGVGGVLYVTAEPKPATAGALPKASPATATSSIAPFKPLEFVWVDPVGSFTAAGAGELDGNNLRVDLDQWLSLSDDEQRRVANALWDKMSSAKDEIADKEAVALKEQGRKEASELRARGENMKAAMRLIDANKDAELRHIKAQNDIERSTISIVDRLSGLLLVTKEANEYRSVSELRRSN